MAKNILIKKIDQNLSVLVYKNVLIIERRKIYIFRDINYFVKMTVSRYVTKFCILRLGAD